MSRGGHGGGDAPNDDGDALANEVAQQGELVEKSPSSPKRQERERRERKSASPGPGLGSGLGSQNFIQPLPIID